MGHIVDPDRALSESKVRLAPGAARMVGALLMAVGAVALVITVIMMATAKDGATQYQALAAYHVGFMTVMAPTLGALVFVMIFQQVNAGWTALLRRQFENVLSMVVPCLFLFVGLALLSTFFGPLWKWMDPEFVSGDPLYEIKKPFLNTTFFYVRAGVYFTIWTALATMLRRYSIVQDESGDAWLTEKARRMSSYGLLLFALTTGFASFDWLMSMDHHWFSTMFGVYYFAETAGSSLALCTLIFLVLRRRGYLQGLVTVEHFHDLGKLLFGFTVFWAYIGFSQYFLIWYANIPEETAWFALRKDGGWEAYTFWLVVGRFVVPFFILMPRPFRRNKLILGFACVWILFFHGFDMFWLVRPEATVEVGAHVFERIPFSWLDITGILGPVGIYLGLLTFRIASGPLVPLKDPRLAESLAHKNYI